MTTPVFVKPDGSPAQKWIEAKGEIEVAGVASWGGQFRLVSISSAASVVYVLSYVPRDSSVESSDPRVEEDFRRLAAEWKQETAHLSAPNMIAEHRAYQEIIGMGKDAIPLILQDLRETKAQWFWALRSIARESPIRPEDRGDVEAMTNAWLGWGRRHKYIDSES